MARTSRRSSTRARAIRDRGRTRRNGASASPSMSSAAQVYWTQKGPDNAGLGRIFRANIEIPTGQTPSQSHDIEVLYRRPARADRSGARSARTASCTGPTAAIRRAATRSIAPRWIGVRSGRPAPEIVFTHLMEGIGIALDLQRRPDVHHRPGRLGLFGQARWLGEADATRQPRETSPASHTS